MRTAARKLLSALLIILTIMTLSGSVSAYAKEDSMYMFGDNLSGLSKLIYNKLVDGYMTPTIEPLTITLPKNEYSVSSVKPAYNTAFNAYQYDFPVSFYINGIGWSTSYRSNYAISIEGSCSLKPYFSTISDYLNYIYVENTAVNELLESIPKSCTTRYDIIKYLNEELIDRCEYDQDALTMAEAGETTYKYAWSAYGALIKKYAVCEGYAKALKYCCDKLGIPCLYAIGIGLHENSQENHAWNLVKMDDGKWYHVDVTWNDPTLNGSFTKKQLLDLHNNYLLKGSADMNKDHVLNPDNLVKYPKISTKNYNPKKAVKESFDIYYGYAHEKLAGKSDKKYSQEPCLNMYREWMFVTENYQVKLSGLNDKATVQYKSSDKSVCSISKKGVITAKKKGTSIITATVKQGGKTYKLKSLMTIFEYSN